MVTMEEYLPLRRSERFWRENADRLNEKNYELLKVQLFERKGQFPASLGRMKKETNGQSADIQLNGLPLSLIQAAPFLKKRGHSR